MHNVLVTADKVDNDNRYAINIAIFNNRRISNIEFIVDTGYML